MTLVRCYPIGVITMLDGGKNDEKILAIPFSDPNFNIVKEVFELPKHMFEEIKHFFTVYKHLEGKETVVDEVRNRAAAVEVIQDAIQNYIRTFQM